MGFAEVALVLDRVTIDPTSKLILTALADRTDSFGRCWPSAAELANRSSTSIRTVRRHIAKLTEVGLIQTHVRRHVDQETGQSRQTSNLYILNLSAIQAGHFHGDWRSRRQHTAVSGSENAWSCQGDKLTPRESRPTENAWSCQGDKLTPREMSGCHDVQGQGDTGDTPRTSIEPPYPSSPPSKTGFAPKRTEADDPRSSVGAAPAASGLDEFAMSEPAKADAGSADASGLKCGVGEVEMGENPMEVTNSSQAGSERESERVQHEFVGCNSNVGTPATPLKDDVRLVWEVLPESMSAVPRSLFPQVIECIKRRLDAGWDVESMREVLESRPLPPKVNNLGALVLARFRDDVPIDGAAPVRSSTSAAAPLVDSAGQVVDYRDIDWGAVAVARHVCWKNSPDSLPSEAFESNRAFAVATGLEKYLIP